MLSQNLNVNKCKKCDKEYTQYRWCKPCQINNFKKNFTNWTSGNEKIDNHIQEMQLKISSDYDDIVFEWIPYDQFDNIKEVSKGDSATVYSAIWKDGPLNYNDEITEYLRISDKKVALKCLYNSQNITEFLNEV